MTDRSNRSSTAHSRRQILTRLPREQSEAELLVGLGFRCWWNGYETGEIACWEQAWSHYASTLGTGPAKRALTDLSCWVRDVRSAARRPIKVHPLGCAGFCRDECLAVAMVAAAQHSCPVLRICAEMLIGSPDVDGVLQSAGGLAETLTAIDKVLSPDTIISAPLGNETAGKHVH